MVVGGSGPGHVELALRPGPFWWCKSRVANFIAMWLGSWQNGSAMSTESGGPELISLREFARRVGISHQRVSQLSRTDPNFPKLVPVGRSKAVDWHEAEPYYEARERRQGERTDLKSPPDEESSST
jgi:predicted DNA-binding transcriptional regulator AlpA